MYINLERIEFVMTYNCTGRCMHCSLGNKLSRKKEHIEYDKIAGVVTRLSKMFKINSVMCFGGEPLIFYKDTAKILAEAKECGIENREIITNGCFSKKSEAVAEAIELIKATASCVLISADDFHQRVIPIDFPLNLAKELAKCDSLSVKAHPAWLVDASAWNRYNTKTKEILAIFEENSIEVTSGNVISPIGNAEKNFGTLYERRGFNWNYHCGDEPYSEKLDDIRSISIEPNGDVKACCFTIGNVYKEEIEDIVRRYNPYENIYTKALCEGGVKALVETARQNGIEFNENQHRTPCSLCRFIAERVQG